MELTQAEKEISEKPTPNILNNEKLVDFPL